MFFSQKLRRIIRKALSLSEQTFKEPVLLHNVIPKVVDILGPTYPEMSLKLPSILEMLKNEQEIFKSLRSSSSSACKELIEQYPGLEDLDIMECSGFVPAFRELQTQSFHNNIIPGKFLFKLNDTYGLQDETIQNIAEILNLQLNVQEWKEEIRKAKLKSKGSLDVRRQNKFEEQISSITKKLSPTENEAKYMYYFDKASKSYEVDSVDATITACLPNEDGTISIVTDKSNFYYTSGGQQGDKGVFEFSSGQIFLVHSVENVNNCIVHTGLFKNSPEEARVGDKVTLRVDSQVRTKNIIHHTATHLLNAAVKTLFNKVTYQVSSSVTPECLKIELGVIGQKVGKEEVKQIEQLVQKVIRTSAPMNTLIVNANDVLGRNDVTLVPGEIYPETGLRLLTMDTENLKLTSRELCCGTHVRNSNEIGEFCITNHKQTNRARHLFTAVAGELSMEARKKSKLISQRVDRLEKQLKTESDTHYVIDEEIQKIRNQILHSDIVLPYLKKVEILDRVNGILKKIKEASRTTLK